jgi:hypothetical protein
MKKTITSVTVAVLALFGAQAAMAQAASSPTREQVKAEAAAANKKNAASNVPGDAMGSTSPKQKAATSDTTRDARKQATADANKKGQIVNNPDITPPISKQSDVSRTDVKKQTADANKKGDIAGAGVGQSSDITPKK